MRHILLPMTRENIDILIELYNQGNSCPQIAKMADFGVSVRQLQRILTKEGVIRSVGDSFRLAVSQGRVTYHKLTEEQKLQRKTVSSAQRLKILQRDNFRCVLCGATKDDCLRLEIDHINENPTDNRDANLQVLCDMCNRGKAVMNGKFHRLHELSK